MCALLLISQSRALIGITINAGIGGGADEKTWKKAFGESAEITDILVDEENSATEQGSDGDDGFELLGTF